jgi:hypothetical protein
MYSKKLNRSVFRRAPILAVDVVESPKPALRRRALLLAASRVCPDAPAMACELVALQRRLGTGAERAGDQDRVNEIALRLSSLIYAAFLLEDEEREGGPADDSALF